MTLGHGDGPIPAKIMIVGEAWGADEERTQTPFVGVSGQELNRMLHESGIMRSECYCTNLINARPPGNDLTKWIPVKKREITAEHVLLKDRHVLPIVVEGYNSLMKEVAIVQPNAIVACGNYALWAFTGKVGIMKMRGSLLGGGDGPKVVPTIHPAAILREWSARALVINDLRRVKEHMGSREYEKPAWNFIIRPSFEQVDATLYSLTALLESGLPLWIDFDIETKRGHIDCVGLSWSSKDAICIPFMSQQSKDGYWAEDQEAWIVWKLARVLTHPNARIRGQNLLYDSQYLYRHWHFIPRVAQDTMIAWHVAFPGLRKSLDFQASILCKHYTQWKPDKSAWKEGG